MKEKQRELWGKNILNLKHPDYEKELADIEERILQYEKTSQYMRIVGQQLQGIQSEGFDLEITEIKQNLKEYTL